MPHTRHTSPQPPRAVSKGSSKAVLVYFPESIVREVDQMVITEDTDRSKWIRKAIREALQRRNVTA